MLVLCTSLIDFDSLDSLYAFLGCQEVGIGNRVREEKPCACCVSIVLEKSRKNWFLPEEDGRNKSNEARYNHQPNHIMTEIPENEAEMFTIAMAWSYVSKQKV